jgi:hypothetical protein
MSRDELDVITRVAITRAMARLGDVFDEFDSRYQGAAEHAVISELRQRTRETLLMLVPHPPEVPQSAK